MELQEHYKTVRGTNSNVTSHYMEIRGSISQFFQYVLFERTQINDVTINDVILSKVLHNKQY